MRRDQITQISTFFDYYFLKKKKFKKKKFCPPQKKIRLTTKSSLKIDLHL